MPMKRPARPSPATRLSTLAIGALVAVGACDDRVADLPVAEIQSALSNIDPRRSLVATELPILTKFGFKRVLDQLVAQSGVPGLTSMQLFRQLWDTQNPKPGTYAGAHCNDQVESDGVTGSLNSYPYVCRDYGPSTACGGPCPSEGGEAYLNPFVAGTPEEYFPIGLFNRFDLAPADGSNCGEHRIVYARRSGITDGGARNLVILEFTMPNPSPAKGLKECQQIARFWGDLSAVGDLVTRTKALEAFYFEGLPDKHGPVVHIDNLGNGKGGYGQIRTNSVLGFNGLPGAVRVWIMREFKLLKQCGGSCLRSVPVTVKNNPFGPLFKGGGTHPRTAAFQTDFVDNQVQRLAAATLGGIDMKISDVYNTGQSISSGPVGGINTDENNYVVQLASSTDGGVFKNRIQAKLTALGSGLAPEHVVARAMALSCAGCHRLNARAAPNSPDLGGGLVWPLSIAFVHVSELNTELVGGVERWPLSPALANDFLPARKKVLDTYLDNKPLNAKGKDPIGGKRVH
jgi:hypothetical protein